MGWGGHDRREGQAKGWCLVEVVWGWLGGRALQAGVLVEELAFLKINIELRLKT